MVIFKFAQIACDKVPAVKYSYQGVRPCYVNGDYIVLDDATVSSYIGITNIEVYQ